MKKRVPKYQQLRQSLAAEISSGKRKPGSRIPSEEQLIVASGMSLGTVQQALRALADDGLVVRRHGSGTFVSSGEAPMNAPFYHCRFLEDDGSVLPIFSQFVRRKPARGEGGWSAHLGNEAIVCIERTFSINREFSIYTHLYFDARRLPALAESPTARLSGVNVKALIAAEHHIALARFAETMRVAKFPDAVCKAIDVARGTSGAVLEIVARDRKGAAVYFQDLFIPPTDRRLFISN